MAYRRFTMQKLKSDFGLQERETALFVHIEPLQPSSWLRTTLRAGRKMQLVSEKAKSEFIVAPIFAELRLRSHKAFSVFSGAMLTVDAKRNLNGECDFILSDKNTMFPESAIFALVEAKHGLIDEGIPRCAAQMLAARMFNGHDDNQIIYGCVTNTDEWQFLKLEGTMIVIDKNKYYFNELPTILGVICHIVAQYVDLPELAPEHILT